MVETDTKAETQKMLAERLAALPKAVRDAITSADVEKELRDLAERHNLHLDQWEILENEVLMTLLGFRPIEKLEENIKNDLDISSDAARELATDIAVIVFHPIREELERSLDNPQAKDVTVSGVEAAGAQAIAAEKGIAVAPATPPQESPDAKAVRAPVSEAYKAGEPSTVRKSVHDDPYREPPA